jgi:hypothetical protein
MDIPIVIYSEEGLIIARGSQAFSQKEGKVLFFSEVTWFGNLESRIKRQVSEYPTVERQDDMFIRVTDGNKFKEHFSMMP